MIGEVWLVVSSLAESPLFWGPGLTGALVAAAVGADRMRGGRR